MSNPPLAGRYVLVDQIGSGGMGSVWRAWDLRNQNFVAAKVLGQHDGGMLLRFVREQSVRIQHPHVVAPSGWAAEDNLVVFTMDLVRGGSVQTLLGDHGPLPESYVAVILDQTLQALAAVHGAGVVHRDIKPANLLLEATGTRRPHVRLGDFGVAALIDEVRLTRFPGAIGTDGYMAPEQIHGASPDPRQDLYAAGVVAIQMLTGLAPRQQQGPPPGRLQPLLAALTSEDTENRPPTAAAALDWLRHLGVPTGAPWQDDPEPPEVFDQLGDVPPPQQSYPGPQSGPQSGDRSAVPSGVGAPQGGPGAAAYSQAPGSHLSSPPPQWQGGQRPGQQQGTGTRYANTHPGDRSAAVSGAATTISMICFAVALALSIAALVMLLA
ncbi:serine/threonine-protein kinase [Nocardioides speluncae]|uniref:serine/threonine-protein kinase n=1 Tax=Nocardioides speluncae TaxID=2670337 RepID=UPI000D69F3C8|nr:serine/threonine-protein kinase [Nocardioides speluncae]